MYAQQPPSRPLHASKGSCAGVDKVPESWLPYLRKFLGKTGSDAAVGGYGGLGQSRLRPKDEAAAEAQWQPH